MAHLYAGGQLVQPGLGRGAEQDGRVVNLRMLSVGNQFGINHYLSTHQSIFRLLQKLLKLWVVHKLIVSVA